MDLLVQMDRVQILNKLKQSVFLHKLKDVINLTDEEIQDCKEAFMLFDRDVDGILSLPECITALHTLGRRVSGISNYQKKNLFFLVLKTRNLFNE